MNIKMKWTRDCPSCGKTYTYSCKSGLTRAIMIKLKELFEPFKRVGDLLSDPKNNEWLWSKQLDQLGIDLYAKT